jgi:hypothetical protein
MKRLWLCLPVCLLFAPSYPWPPLTSAHTSQLVDSDPNVGKTPGLPDPAVDAVAFLEFCLKHYDKTVKDYSLIFRKEERVAGKAEAGPLELVEVCYRAQPYSVFMGWHQGQRWTTDCSLYVEGENPDANGKSQALARSTLFKTKVVPSDPEGPFAKQTSRYAINTFGLRQTLVRVLQSWQAAKAEGTLHVKYLGLHKVPELGNRTCYKLQRNQYASPDNEAFDRAVVVDLVVYIDCETLLLTGTIVTGNEGLLGCYFFTDIKLNPVFQQGQFEPSAVTKWSPASRWH